jgi:hypothetical protein
MLAPHAPYQTPLIPAKAEIQSHTAGDAVVSLDPRFRGDERMFPMMV